jgi:hypothetical protein
MEIIVPELMRPPAHMKKPAYTALPEPEWGRGRHNRQHRRRRQVRHNRYRRTMAINCDGAHAFAAASFLPAGVKPAAFQA